MKQQSRKVNKCYVCSEFTLTKCFQSQQWPHVAAGHKKVPLNVLLLSVCYHFFCNDRKLLHKLNTQRSPWLVWGGEKNSLEWLEKVCFCLTYLHYRVASRQSLHRPSAAFGLIVGPVVGLWLHLNLEVVWARAGGELPVKSRQRWAERQIICPIKKNSNYWKYWNLYLQISINVKLICNIKNVTGMAWSFFHRATAGIS